MPQTAASETGQILNDTNKCILSCNTNVYEVLTTIFHNRTTFIFENKNILSISNKKRVKETDINIIMDFHVQCPPVPGINLKETSHK